MQDSDGLPQEGSHQGDWKESVALPVRFLTMRQAGKVLNVSYTTVQRNMKSKKWPSLGMGRKPLVPVSFIEKLEAEAMASVAEA